MSRPNTRLRTLERKRGVTRLFDLSDAALNARIYTVAVAIGGYDAAVTTLGERNLLGHVELLEEAWAAGSAEALT